MIYFFFKKAFNIYEQKIEQERKRKRNEILFYRFLFLDKTFTRSSILYQ